MALYFSYGSCMCERDIKRDVKGARFVGPATLFDYRLGFTRWSDKRKGGVADIVPATGDKVEGILFEVSDFEGLDRREGHPIAYKRCQVNVLPLGQEDCVEVTTYAVVDKSDQDILPSKEYMEIILDGAKQLSEGYQIKLKKRFEQIMKSV